jgi:hypothetical protein
MAFYVASDPILVTPGYIETWGAEFLTREAAESAARAAPVQDPYIIVEAPTREAAVEQLQALTGHWSR